MFATTAEFKEMIGAFNSFIASSNLLLNVPKRWFVVAFYYGSKNIDLTHSFFGFYVVRKQCI